MPRIVPLIQRAVDQSGLSSKCVSVRSINACVLDTEFDPKRMEEELKAACQAAIAEDGAEAICLGCSGMTRFTEYLEKELGVPVLDGVVAAVKLAEALVDMGKTTSKVLTYQTPSAKPYSGTVKPLEP